MDPNTSVKPPNADIDDDEEERGGLVVHETPTKGKARRPRGNVRRLESLITSGSEQTEGLIPDNLTMTNVKTIIYNVVRDADVQKMLSNTLQEDASKLQPATYEPKMTRAKMKQVLAKEGNIPYPWPRSPKKHKKKKKNNFIELEFPEDDDDEDYNLEKALAELTEASSDEDNESLLSSHASDVGSPMCSAAWSPQVSNSPSLAVPTISARHDNLPQICMGPPPPPVKTSHESEKMFLDALDELDLTDAIARRTRSQLPLTDTTISTLEAEFVAPDVTLDMYEDSEIDEDPEWKDFLQNLLKDDVPVEDDDDPEADPEYNVLAEPDAENEDDHILPVKVYKSEINRLMDELYENEWPTPDEDDYSQDVPSSINKAEPLPINKPAAVAELIRMGGASEPETPAAYPGESNVKQLPTINFNERKQLQRQMECYVQILSQQAVLSQVTAHHLYQQSTHFLHELNAFASSSRAGIDSAFNAVNLPLALQLLADYTEEEGAEECDPKALTPQQKSTFTFSPVFMYPKILPFCRFHTEQAGRRVKFCHAEDVLICMGIEEFKGSQGSYGDLIHKFMVPVHSGKSIKLHVQNECKKGSRNKTTIGLYRSKGQIPGSIRLSRSTITNIMVAPIQCHYQVSYPDWLKTMKMSDRYIPRRCILPAIKPPAPETAVNAETEVVESKSVVTVTAVRSPVDGDFPTEQSKNLNASQEIDETSNDPAEQAADDNVSTPQEVSTDVLRSPTNHIDFSECHSAGNDNLVTQGACTSTTPDPSTSTIVSKCSALNTASSSDTSDKDLFTPVTSHVSAAVSCRAMTSTPSKSNAMTSPPSTSNALVSTPPSHNKVSSRSPPITHTRSPSASQSSHSDLESSSELIKQEIVEGPCMLTILANLSEAYARRESNTSAVVTPTKESSRPNRSPHKSPSKKWRNIAASHLRSPDKQYTPLDPNWKMRHHSPRRKELRSKVQSIVPKSFIPTVYIPSPTKKAAKAISDKALSRASHLSKYKSPLKRNAPSHPEPATSLPAELTCSKAEVSLASTTKRSRTKRKRQVLPSDGMFPSLIESSTCRTTRLHNHCASLATDIIEKDPQRVEREEMFSRWYINKVKDTLGENSQEYNAFLEALITFGKQKKNPAVFYGELRDTVLKDQRYLLQGFAAFLLPAQALACGEKCYRDCLQYNRARRFMRRMEVYFGARSKLFTKMMKLLRECDVDRARADLRTVMSNLLKRHPTLLEEFNTFFADASPPKRHEEDYEEMDLTEYDEETVMDGFEEMDLPEMEVTNATLQCKCDCHEDASRQKYYHLRKKHCDDCMITVWHSTLCIHAGPSSGLRPAYIRYLNNKTAEAISVSNSDDDSKYSDIECVSPTAGSPEAKHGKVTPNESEPADYRQSGGATTNSPDQSAAANPWERDEDRLILEAMQQADSMSLSDEALFSLSASLQSRSTQEIKHRFDTLMQLLSQELGSEDSDSNK